MSAAHLLTRTRNTLFRALLAVAAAQASSAASADPLPVLLVIANQDFHYADYAATRASLEARGVPVVVAAAEMRLAQPQGAGRAVQPDWKLAQASAARYSAIVFVGGWGASAYQYAFAGTYHNAFYRPQPAVTQQVNRLVEEFTSARKPIAAISHGVTVLAWARVDGVSPLGGRVVVGPVGGTPAFRLAGVDYPDAEQPARWQMDFNGALMLTANSVGDPLSAADDVWVDGRIITAQDHQSAGRFAGAIAQSIAARRE